MSHSFVSLASAATTVDWNLVAAAVATFCGTLIMTVFGWFQGKKKLRARIDQAVTPDGFNQVTGAVLLDNQTIREATMVNREVRDQLLLHTQALNSHCRAIQTNNDLTEDLIEAIRRNNRHLGHLDDE